MGECLRLQEEVWGMAAESQTQVEEDANSSGDVRQLAPSLSEVQLVEAFFDVEGRLQAALAAAGHPATAPQVKRVLSYATVHQLCNGYGAGVSKASSGLFGEPQRRDAQGPLKQSRLPTQPQCNTPEKQRNTLVARLQGIAIPCSSDAIQLALHQA